MSRPGLEGGTGRRQQQQRRGELKEGEEQRRPGHARHLGDLRAVARGDADAQPHCQRREAQRQSADNKQGEPECHLSEELPSSLIELSQLRDGRGGRFDPGGQRHRHRKRQGDGQHRCPPAGGVSLQRQSGGSSMGRGKDSAHQQGDPGAHEGQRQDRKDRAPAMPKPGESANEDEQAKRRHHTQGSELREIGHDGGGACRHANRDGEDKIDHQGANGQEGPGFPKGGSGRGRRATSIRETRHELVVVQGHDTDHHDDQCHGRQEQGQIAAQSTQRGFNSIGHRRNGIGHHRKRKRDEQHQSPNRAEGGKVVPYFLCRSYLSECEGNVTIGHGSSL